MRKIELLNIVKEHLLPKKTYKFDVMLEEHGFTALRLPPYHCDINAIEYVWADIKHFIRAQNITADINMEKLLKLTEHAIENVTIEKWKNYCAHVESLENAYWEKDGILEEMCDSLVISLDDDDDSTENE
ncbi:hypothetical protein X975_11209, partial [Stegodyphus mimosarum]